MTDFKKALEGRTIVKVFEDTPDELELRLDNGVSVVISSDLATTPQTYLSGELIERKQ